HKSSEVTKHLWETLHNKAVARSPLYYVLLMKSSRADFPQVHPADHPPPAKTTTHRIWYPRQKHRTKSPSRAVKPIRALLTQVNRTENATPAQTLGTGNRVD